MSTVAVLDESNDSALEQLGMKLSSLRQQKGYTAEYVASKLHLRVRIIELIEQSEFKLLPEPVFVKGYLRAYAKLLGVSPEPFLAVFNEHLAPEGQPERALWQSKRETHKAEHIVRWVTIAFAVGVMVAVGIWWQKNNNQQTFAVKEEVKDLSFNQTLPNQVNFEEKFDDLSKILNAEKQMSPMEKVDV
jgi:cytoskeleton protein RodZ